MASPFASEPPGARHGGSSRGGTIPYARHERPVPQASQRLGHYVLDRELGRGSNGVVYEARHEVLGKPVALKVLLSGTHDQEALQRFKIEATAMSRIDHPGVVNVTDFGVARGRPYYVMEYCRGETLRQRLSRGPLPISEALEVLLQLSKTVAAAHAAEVVHRDLKPSNVIMDERAERSRITDFGLAQDGTVERMTKTGEVLGTPVYMAPEQARGQRDIDGRIDVYALGVMLYECLTGSVPYQGAGWVEMRRAIEHAQPKPPRSVRPEIPPALESLCLRAMAKLPEERHASAAELVEALSACAEELRSAPVAADGPPRWVWAAIPIALVLGAALVGAAVLATRAPEAADATRPRDVPGGTETSPESAPGSLSSSTKDGEAEFKAALEEVRAAARQLEPTSAVLALLDVAMAHAEKAEQIAALKRERAHLFYRRLDFERARTLVRDASDPRMLLLAALVTRRDKPEQSSAATKRLSAAGEPWPTVAKALQAGNQATPNVGDLRTLVTQALELDDSLPGLRVLLASAELAEDNTSEAKAALSAQLELWPDDARATYLEGVVFVRNDDLKRGHARFASALKFGRLPGWEFERARALLFKTKTEPKAALELLNEVLRVDPKDGQALVLRAFAHSRLGDTKSGAADVKKAAETFGASYEIYPSVFGNVMRGWATRREASLLIRGAGLGAGGMRGPGGGMRGPGGGMHGPGGGMHGPGGGRHGPGGGRHDRGRDKQPRGSEPE